MGYSFPAWFACPECGDRDAVSALAYKTDMVFECHECGLSSEYSIGDDVPLQNLDVDLVSERDDDR